MADRYLLESGSPDGYLLEDGSGVLLLDSIQTISLTDNFDDNSTDATKWAVSHLYNGGSLGGTLSETNSRVEITPLSSTAGSNFKGYVSQNTFDLTDKRVFVKITPQGELASGQQADLSFGPSTTTHYSAMIDGLNLAFYRWSGGSFTFYASTTYFNANYAWLSLRHSSAGDLVIMEAAPSTASNPPLDSEWVVIGSAARDIAITAGNVAIQAGTTTSAAAPVAVYFDGFNTATAGTSGYTLTAASGSFALTGTAATLKRALKLTAASGSYSLTGTAATLKKGFKLTAASGAFSLSGTAASFPTTRKLTAAAASFALSGTATSLKRGLKISAASGSFALTGTAATLTKSSVNNYTLTAASGSFALSGTATTLKRGLKLSAAAGSYNLAGTAANLKRGLKLTANSGSYALTGAAVNFASSGSRTMTALPAAFVITGSASTRRLNSAGGGGSIAFFLS